MYGILSGLIYFASVHVIRKHNKAFNQLYLKTFSFLLRPHEVEGLPGAFFFLLGCFLCILLFEKHISMLSILFLSVGDPCASICGIAFKSKIYMEGKSISGTLGCGLACCISSLIFRLIYLNSLHI